MAKCSPYRMHGPGNDPPRSWLDTVMARLVRAINSSTCAATDGPDEPGHDDTPPFLNIGQTPDCALASEMCACGKGAVPAIHDFCRFRHRQAWMAGTSLPLGGPKARPEGPAMTPKLPMPLS